MPECCGPRYSHYECAAAVLQQYPLLKLTHFLHVPKGKNQGDSDLVNEITRILVPAFLSIL
jgi:hypothetical protein